MQNYCLKNIQSIVFRNGFCPYQNPLRISEIMHFQKIIFVFTRNLSYNKGKYAIDTEIGKE